MSKLFTITIPNEPFKTDISQGKTIECVYNGERYLVISVNNDNKLMNVEGSSNTPIDLADYKSERFVLYVIDAYEHPLVASFLTNAYSNEEIPNYTETLPNGEIFEYSYGGTTSLDCVFNRWTPITYDPVNNTFTDYEFLTHISRQQWLDSIQVSLDQLNSYDFENLSEENKQKVIDGRAWLESVETVYPDVDHWKIHWPIEMMPVV